MYKYCRVGTTSSPWRGTRNSPRPHRSTPHQKNARATDRATCFPCKAPTGNARTSGAPREGEVMPDYPSFRDVIFPPAKTSGISISYFSTCLPHHILRHKSRLSHLSQFYHIAHTKKKGKLHKEDRLYHSNCTCRLLTVGHARTGTKHIFVTMSATLLRTAPALRAATRANAVKSAAAAFSTTSPVRTKATLPDLPCT